MKDNKGTEKRSENKNMEVNNEAMKRMPENGNAAEWCRELEELCSKDWLANALLNESKRSALFRIQNCLYSLEDLRDEVEKFYTCILNIAQNPAYTTDIKKCSVAGTHGKFSSDCREKIRILEAHDFPAELLQSTDAEAAARIGDYEEDKRAAKHLYKNYAEYLPKPVRHRFATDICGIVAAGRTQQKWESFRNVFTSDMVTEELFRHISAEVEE